MERENSIWNFITGEYRRKYAQKYGTNKLMGAFDSPHWKDEVGEAVYKECLERGITWKEYYGLPEEINPNMVQ